MTNQELKERRARIIKGLELAYQRLVEYKKQKNTPIIVSKDGKIIELDPNTVLPTILYKWH